MRFEAEDCAIVDSIKELSNDVLKVTFYLGHIFEDCAIVVSIKRASNDVLNIKVTFYLSHILVKNHSRPKTIATVSIIHGFL